MKVEIWGTQSGTKLAEQQFQSSFGLFTNAKMGVSGFDFGSYSTNNLSPYSFIVVTTPDTLCRVCHSVLSKVK